MSYSIGLQLDSAAAEDRTTFQQFDKVTETAEFGELPHATFVAVHADLIRRFPCMSEMPDDEIDDCIWSDGPLINNFGQRQGSLNFRFSAVETVLPFVLAIAHKYGITVLDWQTETIHRPGDLVLMLENGTEHRNPTVEQLNSAVDQLTPDGGPGFAVLSGVRDYVQTAGGDGLYSVEWRQHEGDGFCHYVAGKRQNGAQADIQIPTNGFYVTVQANECLSRNDVKQLLQTFLSGGDRPMEFHWRDTTNDFM